MHHVDKYKTQYIVPHRACFSLDRPGQALPVNFDELSKWTMNVGSLLEFDRKDTTQYDFSGTPVVDGVKQPMVTVTYLFVTCRPRNAVDDLPTPEVSMQALRKLDEACEKNPVPIGEHTLRGVWVDWLSGAAPDLIGGGGPGGAPYHGTPPIGQGKHEFTLRDGKPPVGSGGELKVFVLDTSPTEHALASATAESKARAAQNANNALLDSLMAPGRLTLHPADSATKLRLMDYWLDKYRFPIPDHGLFIAGIIHSIAPLAQLHLVEVLSPYGIGDLESILAGFSRAYVAAGMTFSRVILNCSFMLSAPAQAHRADPAKKHMIVGHPHPDFPLPLPTARSVAALEPLCDFIFQTGGQVFAAAGNDRDATDPSNRPMARYPAAHGNVVGVGALPIGTPQVASKFVSAQYSNFSDDPVKVGISTIGGEDGEMNGVQGLFTGDFEDGTSGKDTNFWASWAGTSFATPVVAAFVAAEFNSSSHPNFAAALAALMPTPPPVTEDEEPVLLVTQA